MSIHEFQNQVRKNENNDLLQALHELTYLDSGSIEDAGWFAWD